MITFYKLYNDEGLIYIGQTQNLDRRINEHRKINSDCSSKIFKGKFKYEILEQVNNLSKEQIFKKERQYIEQYNCVNIVKPGRTNTEYYREYLKDPEKRKKFLERQKKSYEKLGKQRNIKTKIICDCGGKYVKRNKKIHLKTKKHNDYVNKNKI